MNKHRLKNYNEEGLRLRNKKKYLLLQQYLLEMKKREKEELLEYVLKNHKK